MTLSQLGLGTTTSMSSPTLVSGVTGAAQVAIGTAHSCVLLSSGGVRCFGFNSNGQLGDGTMTDKTSASSGTQLCCHDIALASAHIIGVFLFAHLLINQSPIIPPCLLRAVVLTGVIQLTCGGYFTCALMAAGGVRCW